MGPPTQVTSGHPGSPRVIVVGARCARQGTGGFLAGWLSRCGAEVSAIVGTGVESVERARAELREAYGLSPPVYTDVHDALDHAAADALVICCPYRFHADYLRIAAEAGLHCLCEKPLLWPTPGGGGAPGAPGDCSVEPDCRAILDPFESRGLLLQVVAQWPDTLAVFDELHPSVRDRPIRRFEMRLSPISRGMGMIPDAGPHCLSVLWALVGEGRWVGDDVQARSPDDATIRGTYEYDRGRVRCVLHLKTSHSRPRPAWYAINGARVDRAVELVGYRQFLVAGDRRLPLEDPLKSVAERFIAAVRGGRTTDASAIRSQQENLRRMALACAAASPWFTEESVTEP